MDPNLVVADPFEHQDDFLRGRMAPAFFDRNG
jgi:hypothetical protein